MNQFSLYDVPLEALPADSGQWLETMGPVRRHLVRASHWMPYRPLQPDCCNQAPAPESVRPERLHDFCRTGYDTYPLFVAQIPEVTVYSPLMIALRGDTLLRETVPPWRRHKLDFFLTLGNYIQCRDELEVDEPVAMVANYSHTNYFHWLTQCAANVELLRLAGVPDSVKLLLPANSPPYALESLSLMGVPESRLLRAGLTRVRLRKLIYPSLLEEHGNGRLSPMLLDVYARLASSLGHPPALGAGVYLSRQDTRARRIVNEHALIAALEREGLKTVSCSALTVADQVRMAQSASLVVSAHGAAMANLAFTSATTPVLEILPRMWGVSCFYSGSQLRHQPHYVHIENQIQGPETGHHMTMQVDVDAVLRSLEHIRQGRLLAAATAR